MGGNAFPQLQMIRIAKENINQTLVAMVDKLSIPNLTYDYVKNNLLGSAGKQPTSGDIDIVLDQKIFDRRDLEKIAEITRSNFGPDHAKTDTIKMGMINTAWPIVNQSGKIQVDFILGDSEYLKFSHYSPGIEKSQFKGVTLSTLWAVLAKERVLFEKKNPNEIDPISNEPKTIARINWEFDLEKGLHIVHKLQLKPNQGMSKVSADYFETHVADAPRAPRLGYLTNPLDILRILYGYSVDPSNVDTVEKAWYLVTKTYDQQKVKKIGTRFLNALKTTSDKNNIDLAKFADIGIRESAIEDDLALDNDIKKLLEEYQRLYDENQQLILILNPTFLTDQWHFNVLPKRIDQFKRENSQEKWYEHVKSLLDNGIFTLKHNIQKNKELISQRMLVPKNLKENQKSNPDPIVWRNEQGQRHRVDGPAVEWANGSKAWYQNDQLHRMDGPAIEYPNGAKFWSLFGKLYPNEKSWEQARNKLFLIYNPPVVKENQESTPKKYKDRTEWHNSRGQLHRLDGPAMEFANGNKSWWQNGKLHRTDGPAVEWVNGTKEWWQNGQRHRLDGPAMEFANGTKYWYQNGQRHRLDGPAREYADGTKEWWQNGKLHRTDGPAFEYADGTKEWWQNGKLHRTDGPAVEYADGTKDWYQNGQRHRIDGPAVEYKHGHKEWYLFDKEYPNEKAWEQARNKMLYVYKPPK